MPALEPQSQWVKMAKPVGELEVINKQISQFRPWYDESVKGLTILRGVTQAFPEDGSVTAKTVEIRDLGTVTCTGTARNTRSSCRLCRSCARCRKSAMPTLVRLGAKLQRYSSASASRGRKEAKVEIKEPPKAAGDSERHRCGPLRGSPIGPRTPVQCLASARQPGRRIEESGRPRQNG